MKILIKESTLKRIISELFDPNYTYPYHLVGREKSSFWNSIDYRYRFTSKDNLDYDVLLSINPVKKEGQVDFDAREKDEVYTGYMGDNTNKGDAIKVLNTVWEIVLEHRKEMKKLHISGDPKTRIPYYEKILQFGHIPYEKRNPSHIVVKM
jgi:hypothetical protein